MRRKENKKTTQMILVIFIAFIMISSVIGYLWSGSGVVRYNGFKFILKENGFSTKINDKEVTFNYLPTDVDNIIIDKEIINKLSNMPEIDATSDINDTNKDIIALVQYNLNEILSTSSSIYIRQGFTTNNTFGIQIITCEDAKSDIPVIYFKTTNENKIYSKDNCIIIEALDEVNFIMIKDRLLYSLLGVIK